MCHYNNVTPCSNHVFDAVSYLNHVEHFNKPVIDKSINILAAAHFDRKYVIFVKVDIFATFLPCPELGDESLQSLKQLTMFVWMLSSQIIYTISTSVFVLFNSHHISEWQIH